MHCCSCDELLSDKECSRKNEQGEYLDMCDVCYDPIADQVPTTCNELASTQIYFKRRKEK